MLEQLLILSASIVGMGEGKVELPVSEAVERIDAQLEEYFRKENLPFEDDCHCQPVVEDQRVIGFKTKIKGESLVFDLGGYAIEEYALPSYFASGTTNMTELSSLRTMVGFVPLSCVSQISSLVTWYGSSSFGNWEAVSFESSPDNCAQIAAMDLIYTYRVSGFSNPSIYFNKDDLSSALTTALNYQPGLGIELSDFLPGLNAVLTSAYQATYGSYDASKPVICAYSPESGDIGHLAMKIGEAETSLFWFLKTKWDIVVSLHKNYMGSEPNLINHQDESCFFGIKSNREQATFVLSSD